MEQKRNYQKELERVLEENRKAGKVPALLLHSCCAPCSSYVMEYLRSFFRITVFYYNSNISVKEEYEKRAAEQKRLIESFNQDKEGYPVEFLEGDYIPEDFFGAVKGLEKCPEGGERCGVCFALRLRETLKYALDGDFDYMTTTLTISPLKNAERINKIGEKLCENTKVKWLCSDFKKRGGYQRSVQLSEKFHLYRQDYCGCIFSRAEREQRKQEKMKDSE